MNSTLPSRPPTTPRLGRFLAALMLTGYLLFCHGCHGDEDNELWARLCRGAAQVFQSRDAR